MSFRAKGFSVLAVSASIVLNALVATAQAAPIVTRPLLPSNVARPYVPAPIAPLTKGVKTETEAVDTSRGKLTLPAVSSFKGYLDYTSNNAPSGATITLTDSTKNSLGLPAPSSGSAVLYLTATLNASKSVAFNSGSVKGEIASSELVPADTYEVNVYEDGFLVIQIPAGSPNAKGQLKFASPFDEGPTVPANATIGFELVQS